MRMTEEEFTAFMQRRNQQGMAMTRQEHAAIHGAVLPEEPKRSKYGNRRVTVDGMKFDSQHEADVYAGLILRVKAGELKTVLRQVAFDLPGGVRYVADFLTIDQDNRAAVYDAKSEATQKDKVYRLKKRQMRECLGLEIIEL